jgi:hypothetical protein
VADILKKRKAEQAEWEAHVEEHGYPEEEQAAYGEYDEYGEYTEYAQPGSPAPEAPEGGYYEGEGGYAEEDRYGY